jgi:GAF domain
MRWLVEVTSLGRTEKDSLYVDADSWQKALQVARTLRGETEPMSGFSIELLDEGCRAVDPATRISYEVRGAPEEGRAPAGRPSAPPPRPVTESVAPPPRPAPVSVAPVQAAPAHSTVPSQAMPPVQSVPVTDGSTRPRSQFPPRPQISATATMMLGNPPAASSSGVPAVHGGGVEHVKPESRAPRPEPEHRSVPPSSARTDSGAGLPSQIVFKREQDATEALPLTYREYVYVVPPGSTEMAAATLVQTQLELIRASLDRVAAGKLVNLAVFDMTYQGKPPVPPMATLTWKDWRGVALVAFPRQPGRSPVTIPTGLPPAAPVAPPVAAPAVPAPANPFALPAAAPPPAPALAPSTPPANVFAAPAPVLAPSMPAAANVFAPTPAPPNVFAAPALAPSVPAPANVFAPTPAPPNVSASTPAPANIFAPTPAPPNPFVPAAPSPFVPPAANPFAPTPAPAPFAPAPQPLLRTFAETPAPPYGRPLTSPAAPPVQAVPAGRIHGEDLIADLFESMHDLHFARDTVDGGDFCLALAMTKLPSLAGIVQLYDIDRREFVVTNTRGEGAGKLLLRRFPESDPLLAAAMRKRSAVVVPDALQSEATSSERYATIGGARSLIVAPVMLSGRFLGAIELLNPIDGEPFTESDGNAVTYIAEQFAEFVASRGVVTDPERISARPPQ